MGELAALETRLLHAKHCADDESFFPSQAFARGGIGTLIATGSARGPMHKLPQMARAARDPSLRMTTSSQSSRYTASSPTASMHGQYPDRVPRPQTADDGLSGTAGSRTGTPGSSVADSSRLRASTGSAMEWACFASASAILPTCAEGVPRAARHEWQRAVLHPQNFVSTARCSRVEDVRPASKWATLSLYETDPRAVQQHLHLMRAVDQQRSEGDRAEQDMKAQQRIAWATEQRETFRRQRREAADRYARAGLPLRHAYSACCVPASGAGRDVEAEEEAEQRGGSARQLPATSWTGSEEAGARQNAKSVGSSSWAGHPVRRKMAAEADAGLKTSFDVARQQRQEVARRKSAQQLQNEVEELDRFERDLEYVRSRAR